MSQLQLTMVAIGAALLVGVWAFNRFQEWRWHRMARSTLGSDRPDVLLGELPPVDTASVERSAEPAMGSLGAPAAPLPPPHLGEHLDMQVDDDADERPLPLAEAQPAAAIAPADAAAAAPAPPLSAPDGASDALPAPVLTPPRDDLTAAPDEEIEYLVTLGCSVPVSGAELWHHLARASVPVRGARWLGRRVTDGGWNVVLPGSEQRFDSLRAALLLANRSGPASELDVERFCSLVSALATMLKLRAEFPPRAPALQRAEALDAFCAEVDVVVGINVVTPAGQSVPAGRIARWAETHGMVLGRDGGFHLRNAQGHTVWRLVNRDPRPFAQAGLGQMTVDGVTFLLDVPLVDAAAERLSPMFDAAATLARELGARVLDDNGAPLGPQQLGRIARELSTLLQRMESEGIPAGGERARRLFST
ncbi:MAG: hypothetical protein KGI67_11210 [Pseudomonadota bacterium]|nr:hypothetical protein [Pseudomonadota bacterium]